MMHVLAKAFCDKEVFAHVADSPDLHRQFSLSLSCGIPFSKVEARFGLKRGSITKVSSSFVTASGEGLVSRRNSACPVERGLSVVLSGFSPVDAKAVFTFSAGDDEIRVDAEEADLAVAPLTSDLGYWSAVTKPGGRILEVKFHVKRERVENEERCVLVGGLF